LRDRFQNWIEETHSAGLELVRHFLGSFFDTEGASVSGEWKKVAFGLLAMLLSAGILGVNAYSLRYAHLWHYGTPVLFREAMRQDRLSFIDMAMGITALLTVLEWQALFPNRRDCLILGCMPITARQMFAAKFCSLLLIFAAYTVALTAIPALLFAAVTAYPWNASPSLAANVVSNFAATGGACVFAFFSFLALQGILLNTLRPRIFARVSLFAQGVLFIVILGALPLFDRWPQEPWFPTVWFLDSHIALASCMAPIAITLVTYAFGYRRYRRLLLEGERLERDSFAADRPASRLRLRDLLFDRLLPDPRSQAAFGFIWKTLVRSRSHRLILLAYAGLGLGCIVKGAVGIGRPSLHDQGIYGFLAVSAPLAIAGTIIAGLRYLFSMPVALGANWMFQTNERECRHAWLSAVERFVAWCGIAPVLLAALPAQIAIFGALRAVSVAILVFLTAFIAFEFLFRHWKKLPFTCSYIPGKRPILATIGICALVAAYFATVGELVLYCSGEVTAFCALAVLEAVVWRRLRHARRRVWANEPLRFEEHLDDGPLSLGLQPSDVMVTSLEAGSRGPGLFEQNTLVASGGLLPREWQEEIESESARPRALAASFLEDIRFGLRVIQRNPLLSAVVILTLTIGIGVNASVFTVVNGVALRAHVYRDPDSFLRIIARSAWTDTLRSFGYEEYQSLRDRSRTLREVAAYSRFPALIGEDDSAGSFGLAISCNFFALDGLDRAILGRLFVRDDCLSPGVVPPAILSETVWRSRFGSDPNIVGRVIQVNNRPVIVTGIVPAQTSSWTIPASVWLPYTAMPYLDPSIRYLNHDDELWLQLAGRLATGSTRAQAESELNVLIRAQDRLHSGRRTRVSTTDGSWIEELDLTASGRDLMLIAFFLGAFVLVLVIACANVATLLLSRAAIREREIAVRLSLGAPRLRLVRMLVTESLLLSAAAGGISLLLAWKLPAPLFHSMASGAPDFPMPPDWRILAYLSVTVVVAGVLSGLAPAIQSVKIDLLSSLKGYGGLLAGVGRMRLLHLLVSAQVALSMVLLVEAFLFAQSEDRNLRASPGYRPDGVVVSPLHFEEDTSTEQASARLRAIGERLRRLPGVHSVAFSDGLPMMVRDTVEVRPPARADAVQPVDVYAVSPGFLETLGVELLRGRDFQESDGLAGVVSQNLANLFWPGQDAIGRTLRLPSGEIIIVGIAKDVAPLRFGGSDNPAVYRLRRVDPHRNFLAVRFDVGAARAASAVRNALHETDPRLFILARRLQSWMDQVNSILWNVVDLILILGLLATVLAAVGIYGAVRFAVGQRTRELGIRVALGARRIHIIREIFISGGKPIAAGILYGLWMSVAAAAALRRTMEDTPIRLDTTNPVLYLCAAVILAMAAGAAMIGPARRGSRSDPLEAIRCE